MKRYPIVLTIAGSDSGGGAGIQADIKAICATGSYAASAITAITVQNTLGVSAVHNIPEDIVAGQIDAVLSDIGADSIKIGMLSTAKLVRTVRDTLLRNSCITRSGAPANAQSPTQATDSLRNLVLDPVMVATSGDRLLSEDAVAVLSNELAPLARVLTPNIPEAEELAGVRIYRPEQLPEIGRILSERMESISGRKVSVLMKAGHLEGDTLTDYFYNAEEGHTIALTSRKIHTRNTHGTGCTLSSAFASYLAQGKDLDSAARLAKQYISGAIETGAEYEIGHGHGPVNHFGPLPHHP